MNMPAPDTRKRLENVLRKDRGRLLAALIARFGDFQLAEDCLQDACETASRKWTSANWPDRPEAWILRVAGNRAIDRLRRASRQEPLDDEARPIDPAVVESVERDPQAHDIPDERLRLIFTCCHPALDEKSRVALTLRTIGGLSTREIARAFLDNEAAMGQRITRAKRRIRAAGIPFRIPDPEEWGARLGSVLRVVYLVFNEGYSAGEGDAPVRAGLCEEAIWLVRLLNYLRPEEAEIEGMLALMLFAHARRAARLGCDGLPVPPQFQDRDLWDKDMRDEAQILLDRAVARLCAGPFQIQAAISALHMEAVPGRPPDWRQILLLYDRLFALEPGPVVALNRAVALAEIAGPTAALTALQGLEEPLSRYQPYHAARADLLARTGATAQAAEAYGRAIALAVNPSDMAFLKKRRAELSVT